MSHVVGTVQTLSAAVVIGPDSGAPPSPANVWAIQFASTPAPTGTKFLILHFQSAVMPASNRLEVDLGYDTDVFTADDGAEFWTRPINVYALPGGLVPIRYITNGATTGAVQLDRYGRGERHAGVQDPMALSNCDPFQNDAIYTEPIYDPFWYGAEPPNWENVARVSDPDDVRSRVARSVGIILMIEDPEVSSCTVTLVDTDKVISAGHCMDEFGSAAAALTTAMSSSVSFDYETDAGGNRPPGYKATFHKVNAVLQYRYDSGYDYSLLQLQLQQAVGGIPAIQLRHDVPASGEPVFGVHHPNGAVKKLSVPHPPFDDVVSSDGFQVRVPADFAISGGSSGSGLFDTAGRITGILSNGNPQGRGGVSPTPLYYFPTSTFLTATAPAPPPAVTRDVVVVFDRSGSMSLDDGTGRAKIDAAKDAVSLFVQLVKASVGNRIGILSFSTAATSPADANIADLTPAGRTAVIGPAPYSGGVLGALASGGATSIGDGLGHAFLQFPAPGANPRAILLMTDGLQNTYPMIADREGLLTGIDVHAIGFGAESNLNGPLLNALAVAHNGTYVRAAGALALEKFFSHAFGNIFETGILMDPESTLAAGQTEGAAQPFAVCGEEALTVVAGWDLVGIELHLELTTPGGAVVTRTSAGAGSSTGRTWTFLRLPLPFGGERDGTWTARVVRPDGREKGAESLPAVSYFINVVPSGGPRLVRLLDTRRYFTGDAINPLVQLRYDGGGWPPDATVTMTVSRPDTGAGNVASREGLTGPITVAGDTIPTRQATLLALEKKLGHPLVNYGDNTFALGDDPLSSNGKLEAAGIFGKPLLDLLTVEGCYTFHYRAVYGGSCAATREVLASIHVDVGIDAGRTGVRVTDGRPKPDGSRDVTIVVTPTDRYGNLLGPGRGDGFTVSGTAGTTVVGPVHDDGNGSYTVSGAWSPNGPPPGLIISQPGRPPIAVHGPVAPPRSKRRPRYKRDDDRRERAEDLLESLHIRGLEVDDVVVRRIIVEIEVEPSDDDADRDERR